jgi:putative methionine-R-sulfoxide reductase with GAF domain
MNQLKQKYAALDPKARQAFWIAIVLTGAMFTFSAFAVPNLLGLSSILDFQFISNSIPFIIGLASLGSAVLIFNGRKSLGGYVLLAGLSLGLIGLTMVVSGLGLLFAAVIFVTIGFLSGLILPKRANNWSPVFSLILVAIILLLDTFLPWRRDNVSDKDLPVVLTIGGIVLAIYIGFVAFQFRTFPLRTKLVLGFLVAVIVPVSIVGEISNTFTRQALSANADRALMASAAQVASRIDTFVLNNLDEIRSQSQASDLEDFLQLNPSDREGSAVGQRVQSLLNGYKKKDPVFISSYGILDKNGKAVADTNPADIGVDKSDRNYFLEVMRTGLPYVSPLFISKVTYEPVIFFSAPIRSKTGEILGVLRVRYNALVLQQLVVYKQTFGVTQAFVAVVDDHNLLLADSQAPDQIFKSIVPLDEAKTAELLSKGLVPNLPADQLSSDMVALANGVQNAGSQPIFSGDLHTTHETYQFDSPYHREEAAVVRMSTLPWSIVVAAPQDIVFAAVTEQSHSMMLIGIGISMLAVLLAVLLAQYMISPMVSLTETANRLASGDLTARATVKAQDEIGVLATTFNGMASDLNNLFGSLEQRVADRTRALVTSAEVSRRISTILDTNQLIIEVVDQLKAAFNFYHVHIYLFDDARQFLVMAGGSGEAGKTMLARGHKLVRGKGLVGRAADTAIPVLASDVYQTPGWLPNVLLPDTKSEVAVPIAIGENVLGVLDVQQDRVDGLTQEDADLLQSIANQVAVALQNTRTYAQIQSRASREALISAIGQRIQHTTSTEEALKIAVREVGRALNTENVYVKVSFSDDDRE